MPIAGDARTRSANFEILRRPTPPSTCCANGAIRAGGSGSLRMTRFVLNSERSRMVVVVPPTPHSHLPHSPAGGIKRGRCRCKSPRFEPCCSKISCFTKPSLLGVNKNLLTGSKVLLAPSKLLLTPSNNLLSSTQSLLPPTESLLPPTKVLLTSTQSLLPSTQVLLPSTQSLLPSTQVLLTPTPILLTATRNLLASSSNSFGSKRIRAWPERARPRRAGRR